MNIDAVNGYRNKHHRCKTCVHANGNFIRSWYCDAKQSSHEGNLSKTKISGIFCKIYAPILFNEKE